MVGFNRGSTFPSRSSSSRLPLAGMQMTIVLTLGLEDPHTITRGIPWQTGFDDSYESSLSRLYCGGARNNVGSALFADRFCHYVPSFALFVSRYSCYSCYLCNRFWSQFDCSLLM